MGANTAENNEWILNIENEVWQSQSSAYNCNTFVIVLISFIAFLDIWLVVERVLSVSVQITG